MTNTKEFGKYASALRRARTFYASNRELKRWTREKLAQETTPRPNTNDIGLTAKQIADIEQGRVANLKISTHLEPLCRAFKLNEVQKAELYAKAGLLYHMKPVKVIEQNALIQNMLKNIHFPARVFTPVWDIVAINTYAIRLFCYTEQKLGKFDEGVIGPNILRILFDKAFEQERLYPDRGSMQQARISAIRTFRLTSLPYIRTKRYQEIINEMQRHHGFRECWDLSESSIAEPEGTLVDPTFTIRHPDFGKMTFLSLKVMREALGEQIHIAVCVPFCDSLNPLQQLINSVHENNIRFFETRPLV